MARFWHKSPAKGRVVPSFARFRVGGNGGGSWNRHLETPSPFPFFRV
jgi:hypothetical protein